MTGFVDSFATQQLLPPWFSQGARLWVFVAAVRRDLCQKYLDSHFNCAAPDRPPYRYEALEEPTFGILCFVEHADLSSGATGTRGWDTVRGTREVYWSFLAMRTTVTEDNLMVDPTLVWIKPFMLVDNSYVMFSSREIWGDETNLANIRIDCGTALDGLMIDVSVEGLKTFNPRSISHEIGLLRVRMEPGCAGADLSQLFGRDSGLAAYASLLFAQQPFVADGAGQFSGERLAESEVNTLKQFRDVFDMRLAVYRAIVASRITRSNGRDPQVYDGAKLSVEFLWSDSQREVLTDLFGFVPPECDEQLLEDAPVGEIDWNLPAMRLPVAFAVSYTADAHFDVIGILHSFAAAQ